MINIKKIFFFIIKSIFTLVVILTLVLFFYAAFFFEPPHVEKKTVENQVIKSKESSITALAFVKQNKNIIIIKTILLILITDL